MALTKVNPSMILGNGVIRVDISSVAANTTGTFRPLLAAPRNMKITEFRHTVGASDASNKPTVKLQTFTSPSTWVDVSLTGGDDTPDLVNNTINVETPDGDGTASATNYIAAGEGIRVVIDNTATGGGGTDATDIAVEIYVTVVD